jgi:hypothetical protein
MVKSGPSFKFRSQRYWHDGTVDHETLDGRRIKLRRLYTLCPACGVGFQIQTTATAIKTRNLRRRCDGCKRQGVPVEYRRPPKTRRKRPEGATKGNPRPGELPAAAGPQMAPNAGRGGVDRVTTVSPRSARPVAKPGLSLVAAIDPAAPSSEATRAYCEALGMPDDAGPDTPRGRPT